MADAVTTNVLRNDANYVAHFTCLSDGTGESARLKVSLDDVAGLQGALTREVSIIKVEWSIQGFEYVKIDWDHATDDTAVILNEGDGSLEFNPYGKLHDPDENIPRYDRTGNGDILFTTQSGASGATYSITLHLGVTEHLAEGYTPPQVPVFYSSPGHGGDDLGIPAGLNWAGRASVTTFIDAYGLVKEIPADCLAAPGYRLEHNWFDLSGFSEDLTQQGWVDNDSLITGPKTIEFGPTGVLKFIRLPLNVGATGLTKTLMWVFRLSGNGTIRMDLRNGQFASGMATRQVLLTSTPVTYYVLRNGAFTAEPNIYFRRDDGESATECTVEYQQLHDLTGRSNQNPPEYVSVGVESAPMYHNARVDGYKYFDTQLANTVNPDGSVNEATGAALPGPLRLRLEPTATNLIQNNRDFTVAEWTDSNVVIEKNAVGIDGMPNAAQSITDSSASFGFTGVSQPPDAGTDYYHFTAFCKKKTVNDDYSAVQLYFYTGTTQNSCVRIIDAVNGTIVEPENKPDIGTVYESIDSQGDFWKITLSVQNNSDDSVIARMYPAYSIDGLNTSAAAQGTTVFDAPQLVKGGSHESAHIQSTIFTSGAADPRAADDTLVWPLTTPQAEGMAVFEGEFYQPESFSAQIVSFHSGLPTIMDKRDGAHRLRTYDGSISTIKTLSGPIEDASVIASRWNTEENEKQIGALLSEWEWSVAQAYDGEFSSDGNFYVGVSIDGPMFIKSASIYDVDMGNGLIEGNWPT